MRLAATGGKTKAYKAIACGCAVSGLCLAASAQAAEREWKMEFAGLAGGGTKPVHITARERDGAWIAAVAGTYNKCAQYCDFSGVPISGDGMKGRAVIHIAPDAWFPRDHKPFRVEMEIDARVDGNALKGSYKVTAVDSADPHALETFAGRAGAFAGSGAAVEPVTLPERATLEMRLHGALVGGDPMNGERCMVLQLTLDGTNAVSTMRGALSRKDRVFGIVAAAPKEVAVTRSPEGIKARLAMEVETLDMALAACTIELDARLFPARAIGTYKTAVAIGGGDPVVVAGTFDGAWAEGLTAWKADTRPWYGAIPGFVPPKPGEHPRLLFRRSDLDELRRKAETREGKAILKRLRQTLDGGNGDTLPPVGEMTIGHLAGYGLLYQVTGDRKYADVGRGCFERMYNGEKDKDSRYSFRKPNGALRAGPSLGWTAVGYDLCYDAWDEATREKFGRAIAEYDEAFESGDAKGRLDIATLTRGTMPPESNHFGMQVGGAALALLAVTGEPFVNQKRIATLLKVSERSMQRNLSEGFGDGGFFAEGDGAGSMSSQIAFIGALQAWKNAMGRDYIGVERPNARMMTLKWIYLTVIRDGKPEFWPQRGGYPRNIWARGGQSGAGYFAMGMGGVTREQQAAMKWYYERFLLVHDERNGTPYDTNGEYPHFAVCAFVNWPVGMAARNPADVLPHCYRDTRHGFVAWRNRWQDTNDAVISVLLRKSVGYMSAEPDGSLKVMAFGKKFSWGHASGEVENWWQDERGKASVLTTKDASVAVDFTGLSGAEVMLASAVKAHDGDGEMRNLLASTGTELVDARVKVADSGAASVAPDKERPLELTFKFLPEGKDPVPTVKGNVVTVGRRTLAIKNGHIELGATE